MLIGFVLMFIRADMESNPQLVHEWDEIGEDIRHLAQIPQKELAGKEDASKSEKNC